jgi:hypothetical protein
MDDLETEQEGALARMMGRANTIAAQQPGVNSGGGALSMAAAMLAPTKTGHFSESLSRGLGALGEAQDADAKLRSTYSAAIMKALMPQTMGHSLVDPLTGRVISTDPAYLEGKQMDRDARLLEMRLRARDQEQARIEATAAAADRAQTERVFREEQARLAREAAEQRAAEQRAFQKELEESRSADRRYAVDNRPQPQPRAPHTVTIRDPKDPTGTRSIIVDANNPTNVIGVAPEKSKPTLPGSAVQAQIEDLELIGGFQGLNKDLDSFVKKIDNKELNLGLIDNTIARVRNAVGYSTPQSQELASFKATMEKMRNQSLLLNKGVQTEGDAQRAWNELFENMNDSGVVRKRLEEIQDINKRAMKLKMLGVDTRRANFGAEPYDFSKYLDQSSIVHDAPVQPTNRGALRNSAPKPSTANMPKGFSWE